MLTTTYTMCYMIVIREDSSGQGTVDIIFLGSLLFRSSVSKYSTMLGDISCGIIKVFHINQM